MTWRGTETPGAFQRNMAREDTILAACRICAALGKPLPSSRWFAPRLGVSATAARRALARLRRDGRVVLALRGRRLMVERVA